MCLLAKICKQSNYDRKETFQDLNPVILLSKGYGGMHVALKTMQYLFIPQIDQKLGVLPEQH